MEARTLGCDSESEIEQSMMAKPLSQGHPPALSSVQRAFHDAGMYSELATLECLFLRKTWSFIIAFRLLFFGPWTSNLSRP